MSPKFHLLLINTKNQRSRHSSRPLHRPVPVLDIVPHRQQQRRRRSARRSEEHRCPSTRLCSRLRGRGSAACCCAILSRDRRPGEVQVRSRQLAATAGASPATWGEPFREEGRKGRPQHPSRSGLVIGVLGVSVSWKAHLRGRLGACESLNLGWRDLGAPPHPCSRNFEPWSAMVAFRKFFRVTAPRRGG